MLEIVEEKTMSKQVEVRLKLKEILERRGMTQKELAEMTGLREATISELANNTRNVYNKNHLAILIKALNVQNLDELMELRIYESNL